MNLDIKRNLIGQIENKFKIRINESQKKEVINYVNNYFEIILNNLFKKANSYQELEQMKKQKFIIKHNSFIVNNIEEYNLLEGFNSEWILEKTKITEKMVNGKILLDIVDNKYLGVSILNYLLKEYDKNETFINYKELERRKNKETNKIKNYEDQVLESKLYEKQLNKFVEFLLEDGIIFTKFDLEKCYKGHLDFRIDIDNRSFISGIIYKAFIDKEEGMNIRKGYEEFFMEKIEKENLEKEILENIRKILKGELK